MFDKLDSKSEERKTKNNHDSLNSESHLTHTFVVKNQSTENNKNNTSKIALKLAHIFFLPKTITSLKTNSLLRNIIIMIIQMMIIMMMIP